MDMIVVDTFVAILLIAGFLAGIRLMQTPRTALWGNRLGALCMALAMLYTLYRTGLLPDPLLWSFIIIGSILGLVLGQRIKMIHMPQMVALLNGLGGAASALVAGVAIILYATENALLFRFTAAMALGVGPMTFSGSIIAALKLQNRVMQQPVIIRAHHMLLRILLSAGIVLILLSTFGITNPLIFYGIVILFIVYGVLLAIRIGGADMPIIIALFNSFSGVAASVTGLAVSNALLTGVGALVGVAGLVLTHLMCRAMNRSLSSVLGGFAHKATATERTSSDDRKPEDPEAEGKISGIMEAAERVVIVPGYGMALAQAQQAVKELAATFQSQGTQVKIAINPSAGRMIGHMNVLLAEVGIDDDMVSYVDTINPEFPETDLVVVVGACDVVNPAVNSGPNGSVYDMPVLDVHRAGQVIVCNRDNKPGYSGVKNPLYEQQQVIPLWGDAAVTVPKLSALLQDRHARKSGVNKSTVGVKTAGSAEDGLVSGIMAAAGKVIIVPGYGMALAQAQWAVMELVTALENLGKEVKIAVHPVAGRMPGHMHVLLAEVGIDFEILYDMKDINPEFPETDLVVVVGACDVINPAATTARNTPIYGMPVLQVDRSGHVIVCNRDSKPGYSGVDNTLYSQKQVIPLWGDAAETVPKLSAILLQQSVTARTKSPTTN